MAHIQWVLTNGLFALSRGPVLQRGPASWPGGSMHIAPSCKSHHCDGVLSNGFLREAGSTADRHHEGEPLGARLSRFLRMSMGHEHRQGRLFEHKFGYPAENKLAQAAVGKRAHDHQIGVDGTGLGEQNFSDGSVIG